MGAPLVRITEADGVTLDLRYATANNLTGKPLYTRPVALLRPEARDRLRQAASHASALGLRLVLFDAFRPMEVQWALWHAIADPRFVADPSLGGGTHPRGVAVDLGLAEAVGGALLDMGTGFDAMTSLSAHGRQDLPPEALRNRLILLGLMTAAGWECFTPEWWHYHLPDHAGLPALWADAVPDGPL